MRIVIALAAAVLALPATSALAAPSWRDYPGVENTSYVEPSGQRAIQLTAEMPAGADKAFAMFASSEAFASWATAIAKIDFRSGGTIEASYDPKAQFGDPENIINRLETVVPNRLIVLRNLQAPSALPGRALFGQTVTVLQFEPLGPDKSRVTLTNTGYGIGGEWDALYNHFEWGDAYVLASLRKRLEKP